MRIKDSFIINEQERERVIVIDSAFSKSVSLEIFNYCNGCLVAKEIPLKRLSSNEFLFVWSKDFLGVKEGTYEARLMIDCIHCDSIYFLKSGCNGSIKNSRNYGNANCSDVECGCNEEVKCGCCKDSSISIEVDPPSKQEEELKIEKLNLKNIQCERC
ncbi:MAG: hypothetical protein [Caudoviricetes sp.]|nr:MAG: hypothetical protein [Caudoviricetes sp.]